MIWLIPYCTLGFVSLVILWISAFAGGDIRIEMDRPWYENVMSFLVMLFGYSFAFALLFISLPLTLPLGVKSHFDLKKEKELAIQKKQADIEKFEAWKRLPR